MTVFGSLLDNATLPTGLDLITIIAVSVLLLCYMMLCCLCLCHQMRKKRKNIKYTQLTNVNSDTTVTTNVSEVTSDVQLLKD
mmetsp:Transcript_63413/g.77612  ORF Transcript_63413/g.77612 Transcript_63413/m.77612 type:complete len:82 (+) Transcript_63413:26-271(+)